MINVTFSCQTFKLPTVQHYTEAVDKNHTLCNVLCKVYTSTFVNSYFYRAYLWKKALYFSSDHSVCLPVITFVARWLDIATWCQVRSILCTRNWKCISTIQGDPFPHPGHMDHPDYITFWPTTSKLMDEFTPNFTCMQFSFWHTIYIYCQFWDPRIS